MPGIRLGIGLELLVIQQPREYVFQICLNVKLLWAVIPTLACDLRSQNMPGTSGNTTSMAQVVQLVTTTKWFNITSLNSHCTVFLTQVQEGNTARRQSYCAVWLCREWFIYGARFNTGVLLGEQTKKTGLLEEWHFFTTSHGNSVWGCNCETLNPNQCMVQQMIYSLRNNCIDGLMLTSGVTTM